MLKNIVHIFLNKIQMEVEMNKSKYQRNITKLATINEARERYRLGRNSIMKIAEENDAVRRFGRAVRIDIQIMDKAVNNY